MTRKENLRLVLAGKKPRWVPFAPNFSQWFGHHRKFNLLPEELRGCGDYIDAMKALGCDIFSRNLDGGCRGENTTLTPRSTVVPGSTGPRRTTEYATPFGTLREVHQEQTSLSTGHQEEYCVKDWKRDGDALRYFLEQRRHRWDEEAFAATHAKVGGDGIVNVPFGVSPLKMLHGYLGLEYTCFFVMDEPAAAKALCDEFWQTQMRPVLHALANHPLVESAILMDNVDTPFYPPALAAEFWTPYVKEAAEVMRARGKTLFVHACGKLAGLAGEFSEARVSGLEGISHPPLGDWPAAAAQTCHPEFIFVGGFSAREQELLGDAQVRAFYREYLGAARKERFIFASSCQTSIDTKWERIKLVRDLCREWGGCPRD
jgi:hypothetical protein